MKAVLTALALCVPLAALAAPKAQELILDNGLKVIVKEDRRAPVVTSQVWYRIGSSYEYGGITGVSHVLEHMMFKGTEKHAPGEFSRIVAESGGDENAFTGRDYTAYYQNLAKDRLEVSFELEADRMRNLSLPPEEFDKELAVVQEERRLRTDDDPKDLAFERFNAVAYAASPYRNPVIGWEGDLAALTVEDLRDWYRQWYAPNNATLVVVGDVDPEAVFDLATQALRPAQGGAHRRRQAAPGAGPTRRAAHPRQGPGQGALPDHGLQGHGPEPAGGRGLGALRPGDPLLDPRRRRQHPPPARAGARDRGGGGCRGELQRLHPPAGDGRHRRVPVQGARHRRTGDGPHRPGPAPQGRTRRARPSWSASAPGSSPTRSTSWTRCRARPCNWACWRPWAWAGPWWTSTSSA